MKKITAIAVFSIIFVLTGCTQSMAFDFAGEHVIMRKNVLLGESCDDETSYEALTIESQEDIDALLTNLNRWEFSTTRVTIDVCGYLYTIEWEKQTVTIVDNTYFYINDTLYELKSGSIDFLEDYTFNAN